MGDEIPFFFFFYSIAYFVETEKNAKALDAKRFY